MKKLLLALGFFLAALAFSIFSCLYVRNAAVQPLNALRLARIHAQDGQYQAAAEAVERAELLWDAHSRFFDVVLCEDETDGIEISFASLRQYALSDAGDAFSAACAEMIASIEHIRKTQLPVFYNIL